MAETEISILIVDDEAVVRDSIASWLEKDGYTIFKAPSGEEALSILSEHSVDITLIDLKMPVMDGIELLENIRNSGIKTISLILTAHATVSTAVEAMKKGAYDYMIKPFNPEEVSLVVDRIGRHIKLVSENKSLKSRLEGSFAFSRIVTCSDKMLQLFSITRQVAKSKATVLILGESGTGKELLARAIHEESPRAKYPFIPVSCAALNESLLEDEIFGHEKGAFTDAREVRKGKFELSDGGSIFLDEIGDIGPKLQLDLLRVLQEKEITRLGGSKIIKVDTRVISATNRDIEKLVENEVFREDLFYRLNVITLQIPPLRERTEDIPLLADYFISKYVQDSFKSPTIKLSNEALETLIEYPFPGNIRELEGAIEHAVILTTDDVINREHLPARVKGIQSEDDNINSLKAMELRHILKVLKANQFNIAKSSRILGIDRSTLYTKIEKYGIQKNDA